MTTILTRSEIALVLPLDDCIAAVEEVFRRFGDGSVGAPCSLELHGLHGAVHVKAALTEVFAAKMNANFPGNPERNGLPTIQGVVVVVDAGDGTLLGILDSMEITRLRTAAATAVAAKHLARHDTRTATIVGCGVQGRAQLEALARVCGLERAFALDLNRNAAERFASDMSTRLGIDVRAENDLDDAVRRSDAVVTCTPSNHAVLDERHARPGLFIAGVGADNPRKSELSPSLLARCLVVPDLVDQAAVMGDLHCAIDAGVLTREDIYAELPEIVCGKIAGRTGDEQTFVFDSTGTALQDVAAAALALGQARERGIGREIAFGS